MKSAPICRFLAVLALSGSVTAQVDVKPDPGDTMPGATPPARPGAPGPSRPAAPPATPAPTPPAAPAAPPAPSPVDNLRVQQETQLKKTEEALARQEWDALRAMEKARVEKSDYEGAARVAARLLELEKAYPVLVPLSAEAKAKAIVLEAGRAYSYTKGFGIAEKDGVLTFGKTDAFVRWDNVTLKPGLYRVRLSYSTGNAESAARRSASSSSSGSYYPVEEVIWGGRVAFLEDTSLGQSQILSAIVPPTEKHTEFSPLVLGTLQVTASRAAFILKAVRAASGGLMNLKSVELIPETATADGEPKEFADLRTKYRQELSRKMEPTHKSWLVKLVELEKTFADAANAAGLTAVREEQTRLQAQLASPNDLRKPEKTLLRVTDKIGLTYTGEIRPSNSGELLQRLRPAGSARVSFKLGKIVPGKYQVVIHCNTSPLMGGTYRLTCGAAVHTGKVDTPASYTSRDIQAGVITIAPGTAYLDFAVESLMFKDSSLCELRSIELIPAES